MSIAAARWLPLLVMLLVLAACRGQGAASQGFFLDQSEVPGWHPTGEVEVFDEETLYDLVDGQADSYFAYGFEQVTVYSYQDAAGQRVDIEVWQVATPADAYGLFTANRAGEPVDFGNDGDADAGRRLAYWQDRTYVRIRARQELPDVVLQGFARAVADALPGGGQRPALVDELPPDGLDVRSLIFFHEEISIQSVLWLGGENVLALNAGTNGVLATYELAGVPVQAVLVQYPDAPSAAFAREALVDSGAGNVAAAEVRDSLLGAVFGDVDESVARVWLAEALGE